MYRFYLLYTNVASFFLTTNRNVLKTSVMEEFLFFSRPTLKQFYFITILRDVLNLYWCRNVFVHVVWTYGNLAWSVKVLIQSFSLSVTLCLSSSVQSVLIRRIGVSIEANFSDIRPTWERKNGLHWTVDRPTVDGLGAGKHQKHLPAGMAVFLLVDMY